MIYLLGAMSEEGMIYFELLNEDGKKKTGTSAIDICNFLIWLKDHLNDFRNLKEYIYFSLSDRTIETKQTEKERKYLKGEHNLRNKTREQKERRKVEGKETKKEVSLKRINFWVWWNKAKTYVLRD